MLKRFGAIVGAAITAVVLLPGQAAYASTIPNSSYDGCYGIKATGNYNHVHLFVRGTLNGSTVGGYGRMQVDTVCQEVNSLPLTKMTISVVELRRASDGHVLASSNATSTTTSWYISRQTPYVSLACGVYVRSYMKVTYTYYNQKYVNPFWIKGPQFKRC